MSKTTDATGTNGPTPLSRIIDVVPEKGDCWLLRLECGHETRAFINPWPTREVLCSHCMEQLIDRAKRPAGTDHVR